jgi:hypothetical protein
MPPVEFSPPRVTSSLIVAALVVSLMTSASCSRKSGEPAAKLTENLYGLYLGETKGELQKAARGVADMKPAPEVPLGYRGELYNLSAPLEPYQGIDHVRVAFFNDRLWEIVVYFRDTSADHLNYLKAQLEGTYGVQAKAPDGTVEMAFKTYRLEGPGMSVTLRRITKKDTTELYVQYIHKELQRELIEKGAAVKK